MNWLLLLILVHVSTQQECFVPSNTRIITSREEARINLLESKLKFSFDFFRTVNDLNQSSNIIFSPTSIFQVLLISYFMSATESEVILKGALRLPENQNKWSTYQGYYLDKYIQEMMKSNGSLGTQVLSANKIFVSSRQQVRECMMRLFKDEITVIEFKTNIEAARKYINRWVEEKTMNQIRNLIKKLHPSTRVVLASTAYFKAMWEKQFNPQLTRNETFYPCDSENGLVMMMRETSKFKFLRADKLGADILKLPYKGSNVSMFIFLPFVPGCDALFNVLSRLTSETFWEIVRPGRMRDYLLDVSIPKFTIETELDMKKAMKNIGLESLYDERADFSTLTGHRNLYISSGIHKAKIQVDEEGTTASAATAIIFRRRTAVKILKFSCNRPFIYLIYDNNSKSIHFMGIFRKSQNII